MTSPVRIVAASVAVVAAGAALITQARALTLPAPTGAASTAQSAARSSTHQSGQLVVTPGAALFDITLAPGQTEYRAATLDNRGGSPVEVSVRASVVDSTGVGGAAEHLTLAVAPNARCNAEAFGGRNPLPLLQTGSIAHGVIAGNTQSPICLAASLAATGAGLPASTTRAHLEFDAIEMPAELAFTGADLVPLALAAVAAFALGVTLRPGRSGRPEANPVPIGQVAC